MSFLRDAFCEMMIEEVQNAPWSRIGGYEEVKGHCTTVVSPLGQGRGGQILGNRLAKWHPAGGAIWSGKEDVCEVDCSGQEVPCVALHGHDAI